MIHPRHALALIGDDQNAALGVQSGTGIEGLGDDGTGGKPGSEAVCEFEGELLADEGGSVEEAEVFGFGGLGGVEGCGCA
jgi:hypothetical protein